MSHLSSLRVRWAKKTAGRSIRPAIASPAHGPGTGVTRYARSGDLRIAYELRVPVVARRRPWLVLVQGLGFDRTGWEPILAPLQRRFRLILIDNRGSGDSDPSPQPFQVAQMAKDVIAVLDHAGIATAHMLGISLGGMIAQELAAEHPDRVDALVLAATTPRLRSGYPVPRESMALFAAGPFLSGEAKGHRHVTNALAAETVRDRPEVVEHLVAHVAARPTSPRAASGQAIAGAGYVSRHGPEAIRARTLVLHGDADTVVDPRNGRMLASRIPDAQLQSFPGLGHLMFWEDPDAFAAAVTSFLLHRTPGIRAGRAEGTWTRIRKAWRAAVDVQP
jgi:3-oxoadipate enol-lactonase